MRIVEMFPRRVGEHIVSFLDRLPPLGSRRIIRKVLRTVLESELLQRTGTSLAWPWIVGIGSFIYLSQAALKRSLSVLGSTFKMR